MKTSISNNIYRKHVVAVFYHIRDLRRICRFISLSFAKTIATALVSGRFDYCNSILNNSASKDIAKLQLQFFSKDKQAFYSFFLLSAASKIIAMAPSHYRIIFSDLYSSLSSTLIYTTSISKFDANTSKKFQTATLNQ
ncbi:hypothetical protein NP493_1143g01039 [Ridgeia piscesae]|uniref:Uncharacterized protein n=1 Tax=Ridgeia piscesae TaxID=27915 RepID=A0AAD9KGH0_RIDPI|nr:hypothetical protein NP493_1143g01039 [Ridgeia piscesae]